MRTELTREKKLLQVSGQCAFGEVAATVSGYEIHMGVSSGPALERPAFVIDGRGEGRNRRMARSWAATCTACSIRRKPGALLAWAGLAGTPPVDLDALREASLERLAESCRPLYEALQRVPTRFAPK
jgi:adenosylcobyric acid synthase